MAGFYERNDKITAFYTGIQIGEISNILEELERSVLARERWIFVKNFLKHQKNLPLNPDNNAHKAAIKSLKDKKSLYSDIYKELNLGLARGYQGASQGLVSPIGKGKGKDKGKKGGEGENKGFDLFYAAYPRHEAGQKARESFERLNPNTELLAKILEAIENQKRTDNWKKSDGQFIPLPATWLNQRRWEDEIDNRKRSSSGWDKIMGKESGGVRKDAQVDSLPNL